MKILSRRTNNGENLEMWLVTSWLTIPNATTEAGALCCTRFNAFWMNIYLLRCRRKTNRALFSTSAQAREKKSLNRVIGSFMFLIYSVVNVLENRVDFAVSLFNYRSRWPQSVTRTKKWHAHVSLVFLTTSSRRLLRFNKEFKKLLGRRQRQRRILGYS